MEEEKNEVKTNENNKRELIEVTQKIEARKEKIKNWLKDPSNLIFIGIIIFAIAIRLYYFFLTKNQPLWWDEGEYGLKAKAFAFGTPATGWYGAREIVVPFLFSLVLRFGGTEVVFRFVQLIVSCATIFVLYLLAKEMFNRRIALISTLILSVNAVHLFFTCRILTYLWAPFFFVLSFYLFYQGYINGKSKKYLYSFAVIAALGLSTYGSLAFGLLAIVVFLFITERFNFLKKKELWLTAGIGFLCLIPQFIYSQIAYGTPIGRWAGLQSSKPENNFSLIFDYFKLMPHLFGKIFVVLILVGAIYILFTLLVSYDLILKNQHKNLKSYLLIFLWALAVLGFYTYISVGWGVTYDGFVLSSLPALAVIGAVGLNLIYNIKFNKVILTLILIVILIFGAYNQVVYADSMIKNKMTSFDGVKYAGEWINQNSNKGDIIISSSLPQMTYYSERETYPYTRYTSVEDDPTIRNNESDFDNFVALKKPRFITDSLFENVPPWVHAYASKHNNTLIPVQVYFMDAQKTQPSIIIYAVKY